MSSEQGEADEVLVAEVETVRAQPVDGGVHVAGAESTNPSSIWSAFGQEATEPAGGRGGVAAEVREAVLRLVEEVNSVRAGVPAQRGQ
ncbi:hypothetical protein ABR737_36310 [Streptomyces sp. Edi2]|uniref:hypothetical protein n=1 Tax=Streptomyces sp. Edi2 TaxID=3162528 RepID=UPI00330620FE